MKKKSIWVLEWRKSVHYRGSHILFAPECKELTCMLDPLLYRWGVPPHWTMQSGVLQTWITIQSPVVVMGWVRVDVTELPWEHPVCWTNAGEIEIRHPVVMECPRTACVGSSVAWSRTGETWGVGVHDGWRERRAKCDWWWMKVFWQAWPWTLTDGIGVVWEKLGMILEGKW